MGAVPCCPAQPRPVAVTAMEKLEWYTSDALTGEARANPPMLLTAERETEVLAAWIGMGAGPTDRINAMKLRGTGPDPG